MKVTTLHFVIPSEAEGPAVRTGSFAKVSAPLVLSQTRHPACPGLPWEQSVSPIDHVIQRLWLESSEQFEYDRRHRGPSTPRRKRCITRSIGEALRSG